MRPPASGRAVRRASPACRNDLVREALLIVGAPQQGNLAAVGLEEGGIADQAGAGDVGVGDRHGSVREKRAFWLNSQPLHQPEVGG